MKRGCHMVACVVASAAAFGALVLPVASPMAVRLVYNPSDSVARGWYRIVPVAEAGALQVDDIVLARLPAAVVAFAAQRRYLSASVPILKRVGAVAPQAVCVQEQQLRIDGDIVATVRTHDGALRPMQAWTDCRRLLDGELFLLSSTNPASFDSRYFGPVDAAAVLGVAYPVWTW